MNDLIRTETITLKVEWYGIKGAAFSYPKARRRKLFVEGELVHEDYAKGEMLHHRQATEPLIDALYNNLLHRQQRQPAKQSLSISISNLIGHLVLVDSDNPEAREQLVKVIQQGVEEALAKAVREAMPETKSEPTPGIYECVLPFKNEMGYQWKQGEKVEVLRYSAQFHTVMCKLPGEAQEFEMNADLILNEFKKKS